MVMALDLFYRGSSLTLVTAYENGLATIFQQDKAGLWQLVYRAQCHSQPILSVGVAPSMEYFLTSSADALLVKHPIPKSTENEAEIARAGIPQAPNEEPTKTMGNGKSLLSAALAKERQAGRPPPKIPIEVQTQPLKIINTRHSGQQSLRMRSDEKIFATAGWDSKIRVYSAKTMKELAVLKWHQVGCYTVSFTNLGPSSGNPPNDETDTIAAAGSEADSNAIVSPLGEVTVKEHRIKTAKESHWLAAGSKDGRISLWDIY
jgi:ASTRA-associated protein 1